MTVAIIVVGIWDSMPLSYCDPVVEAVIEKGRTLALVTKTRCRRNCGAAAADQWLSATVIVSPTISVQWTDHSVVLSMRRPPSRWPNLQQNTEPGIPVQRTFAGPHRLLWLLPTDPSQRG